MTDSRRRWLTMRIHNLSVWVVTTICCKRRNQWSRHFDDVIPAAGVVNGTSQGLSRHLCVSTRANRCRRGVPVWISAIVRWPHSATCTPVSMHSTVRRVQHGAPRPARPSVGGVAGDHQVDAGHGGREVLGIAVFALDRRPAPEDPRRQIPPVYVAVRILGPVRCLGERSHGVAQRVPVGANPTSPTQRELCRFSLFATTQVIELLNLCTPNSPQYCL